MFQSVNICKLCISLCTIIATYVRHILNLDTLIFKGTFAVICLMSGKVASEKATYYLERSNIAGNSSIVIQTYSTLEINTALSLCVGMWQVKHLIIKLKKVILKIFKTNFISTNYTMMTMHSFR